MHKKKHNITQDDCVKSFTSGFDNRVFKKYFFAITLAALFLLTQIISIEAHADKTQLPRKLGPFELGANANDIKKNLVLFKCTQLTSTARECRLIGYPARDDFVMLKFYEERLVSVAEFRANADWKKTLEKVKQQLGEPTLPAYKSSRATAYIWQDKETHITLTHLIKTGYVIYDIRDRAEEPLYRRSVAAGRK